MKKEFNLRFRKSGSNKRELKVEVTGFKNDKQVQEFIKSVKINWS